ncbi:MAG: hypothetical protein MJ197_02040 [Bacteroidales bacterium]|nr:hypothetical protein [Bacteroidales bacterium]
MLVYAEISIEVGNNSGAGTCTVRAQTDLEVLRNYVQNATIQPAYDRGYTTTIQTNCGETTYTFNSCFLDNADIDRLAELILEQTNCQNNQNN